MTHVATQYYKIVLNTVQKNVFSACSEKCCTDLCFNSAAFSKSVVEPCVNIPEFQNARNHFDLFRRDLARAQWPGIWGIQCKSDQILIVRRCLNTRLQLLLDRNDYFLDQLNTVEQFHLLSVFADRRNIYYFPKSTLERMFGDAKLTKRSQIHFNWKTLSVQFLGRWKMFCTSECWNHFLQ